jgi:hypothetical protein
VRAGRRRPGPCTSPQGYTALADGTHAFQAQATDPAGKSSAACCAFTIDTTPSALVTTAPVQSTMAGSTILNDAISSPPTSA